VFRSGLALALKLPDLRPEAPEELAAESAPIEQPHTEEAVVEPCQAVLPPESPQETEPVSVTIAPEESLQELSVQGEIEVEQPTEPSAFTDEQPPSAEPDSEKSPSNPEESDDAL